MVVGGVQGRYDEVFQLIPTRKNVVPRVDLRPDDLPRGDSGVLNREVVGKSENRES